MAVLFAASAPAASQERSVNVTGVWTGTFPFTGGEKRSAYLKLEQKDSQITGTSGPDADGQAPIAKGRIATVNGVTTVTFEVSQPNGPSLKFELELVPGGEADPTALPGQCQHGHRGRVVVPTLSAAKGRDLPHSPSLRAGFGMTRRDDTI